MASPELPAVVHKPADKCFTITLPEGTAVLEYEQQASGELDYYHTEVPESCRGKGLGGVLAKAALDYAVAEGKTVRLTCTYLQHYLTKHQTPEYMAAVKK